LPQQNEKRVRAEVKLPLILIHTPFGLDFFDRVAKWRAARIYADFNTYLMPMITALAIFLIISALVFTFGSSAAREGARGIGLQANLLIPGINPYLPITYGWMALIVTIVIHEAGHGIVARVYNIRVDSTGLVLFLGIPIGAFVNIEKEELNRVSLKQKSAVLTAGPLNNMILAGASLLGLYLIMSTLVPLPPDPNSPQFGTVVVSVNEGSLAQSIGLTQGSIIQSIAGQKIIADDDLRTFLQSHLGETVEIEWLDRSGKTVTKEVSLPSQVGANQPILGISASPVVIDSEAILENYKSWYSGNPIALLVPPTIQQVLVPYSDFMAPHYTSTVFGNNFSPIANGLFWLWFINFNVGIFNALPIGPLDGGQLYGSLIEKKAKSQYLAKYLNSMLTMIMAAIVIAVIFLPYIF
jgi:membrane-associated protease RseP (regulator of RpoE activity)